MGVIILMFLGSHQDLKRSLLDVGRGRGEVPTSLRGHLVSSGLGDAGDPPGEGEGRADPVLVKSSFSGFCPGHWPPPRHRQVALRSWVMPWRWLFTEEPEEGQATPGVGEASGQLSKPGLS